MAVRQGFTTSFLFLRDFAGKVLLKWPTNGRASLLDKSVSPIFVLILDKKLSWDLQWLAIIQSMGWSSEVVINNSWKCCKSKCTHNGCFPTSYEKFGRRKNSKEINTLANYFWVEWEIAIMTKDFWCFKQFSMLYLASTPFPTQFFFLLSWTNPG